MNNFSSNEQPKKNPFQVTSSEFELDFETDYEAFEEDAKGGEFHLNDYDINLLRDGAYKNLDNEVFKLEYKISRIEEKLKLIDSQLKSMNALGETERAQNLLIKRRQYENELNKLTNTYKTQSLPTSLSGGIISFLINIPQFISNATNKILKQFGVKLPDKLFNANSNFKEALIALECINKNVDELISVRSPYGESEERYSRLLKYLNKANHIQAQISAVTKSKSSK